MFGHAKLGGIGKEVSAMIKELSPKYNDGSKVDMIAMNLGYLVRSGDPDSLDSIVPLVFGNLAVDHILRGDTGRMVALRNGRYDSVPIDTVVAYKKVVDVERSTTPSATGPPTTPSSCSRSSWSGRADTERRAVSGRPRRRLAGDTVRTSGGADPETGPRPEDAPEQRPVVRRLVASRRLLSSEPARPEHV